MTQVFRSAEVHNSLQEHDNGAATLWQTNGSALQASTSVGQAGAGWHIQDAADFSGGGKANLLLRHDNGVVAMWRIDGARVVSTKTFGTIGTQWDSTRLDDFDGNGRADILWRNDRIAANVLAGSVGVEWHM